MLHPWRHSSFNLFQLTWYILTAAVCLSTVFSLFLATSLPFVLYLLSTVSFSSYNDAVCIMAFGLLLAASLLRYFLDVCFIFLATAMLFVIVVSLLDQICGCYIRRYVSPVISDAWVHAYINVQHICTLIRRVGRAGEKSVLCRQKFAQDFSFKILSSDFYILVLGF